MFRGEPLLLALVCTTHLLAISLAVHSCQERLDCDYTGCNDQGEDFYCTLGHCGFRQGEGFFVCNDPPPCKASPGSFCQGVKDLPFGRVCPQGSCCAGDKAEPAACVASPGRYCASGSASCAGRQCPPGHFCVGGSAGPEPCELRDGWFCPAGSSTKEGLRVGGGLNESSVKTVWQLDGFHVDLHTLGIIFIVVGFLICLIVL
eukprot:764277-Hanusia_phi.AAC.4